MAQGTGHDPKVEIITKPQHVGDRQVTVQDGSQ